MDDQRVGTALRSIRIRRGLRQADVAAMARVSPSTISRIERDHLGSFSLSTLRRVSACLDARLDVIARWRAGDLDRMLNARHSRLHELVARRFRGLSDWRVAPEVSFWIRGERGVVDILAFNRAADMLLVIELKTDIVDVNELVGTVDRKRRLAIEIAREPGWIVGPSTRTSVWVIVAEGSTNRRRVGAHRTMLRAAFPIDGRTVPGWLPRPSEPIRVLSFWSDEHPQTARSGLAAIRRVPRRPAGPDRARAARQMAHARPRELSGPAGLVSTVRG